MLLSLHDQTGVPVARGYMQVVGTAILCELVELGRIRIGNAPKHLVTLKTKKSIGDPILDELQARMICRKNPSRLTFWIGSASSRAYNQRICNSLSERGILKKFERKIFWGFRKSAYPDARNGHKEEIRRRMEAVMFNDNIKPDPRTAALVSIVDNCQLMDMNFPAIELRRCKKRIKWIQENATLPSTNLVSSAFRAAYSSAGIY